MRRALLLLHLQSQDGGGQRSMVLQQDLNLQTVQKRLSFHPCTPGHEVASMSPWPKTLTIMHSGFFRFVRLQPLLLSHFDESEFINLLSLSYLTLSNGSCGLSSQVLYTFHIRTRLSHNLHIALVIAWFSFHKSNKVVIRE